MNETSAAEMLHIVLSFESLMRESNRDNQELVARMLNDHLADKPDTEWRLTPLRPAVPD
jgi:hypothetical protein